MAKVYFDIVQPQGRIGNVVFAKTKKGIVARQRPSFDKNKFKNDPAFERQRHNAAEFSASAKAAKLLRRAFENRVREAKDSTLTARMQRLMMCITKSDCSNCRGERNPADGPLKMLEGLRMNAECNIYSPLVDPENLAFTRASGKLELHVPAFTVTRVQAAPAGATHYRLVLDAAVIDFKDESFNRSSAETALQPIASADSSRVQMRLDLPENSSLPVFVMISIRFFEVINGIEYADFSKANTASDICLVHLP